MSQNDDPMSRFFADPNAPTDPSGYDTEQAYLTDPTPTPPPPRSDTDAITLPPTFRSEDITEHASGPGALVRRLSDLMIMAWLRLRYPNDQ